MQSVSSLMAGQTLLPIIQADSIEDGLNITKAMQAAGLTGVEVVLRSEASLDALKEIKSAFPDMVVSAGTVYTPEILDSALAAGADFIVTPTTTDNLLVALKDSGVPFIPGVSSMHDVARMMEQGVTEMKLFPAQLSGGTAFLKAIGSLFKEVSFCPTGGINQDNKSDYLALPNVFAVGGTWVSQKDWVAAEQWDKITQACVEAVNPA